jgi:transcriptional regulator with XRE-family HTH domain
MYRNIKLAIWKKRFYLEPAMSEFTEVTADNLRFIRGSRGMNQDEVAEILGIAGNQVSKIEKGIRALSDAEKRLLDWYFFGTLPPRLIQTLDLQGVLEFTEDEWNIIGLMAKRAGQTHAQFIRSSILGYLYHAAPEASHRPAPLEALPKPVEGGSSGRKKAGGKAT